LEAIGFELWNAFFPMLHGGTFQALLVLLATFVQLVDGNVVQSLTHGSIPEAKAIASISPVLTRIELGIIEIDLSHQLLVASL